MRALLSALLLGLAALPAQAGYIYELTGHISHIGDNQNVPDVLHVGDTFRASFEYFSTSGAQGGDIGGLCTDSAMLRGSFDFGHATVSAPLHPGCVMGGTGIFFAPLRTSGDLDGLGTRDVPWGFQLGNDLFPDDISDALWLSTTLELRLFGPLPSAIVQYYVSFDKVHSRKVPEPSALALLAIGLVGGALAHRRILRIRTSG